jgi:hypothetical protein
MKHLILLSFLVVFSSFSAQNFEPFKHSQPKRFQHPTNPNDNDYFFYSLETLTDGDTTFFKQYFRMTENLVDVINDPYCSGWGGGMQPQGDTTWLGLNFKYNSASRELSLKNANNEELNFDFSMLLGDSALFYSATDQQYYIRYDAFAQELIIDSLEWVKTFTIHKYNDLDELVVSPLNDFQIRLSENLGLASFINCKDFPAFEQGYVLQGQLNPTIGYYQLTYDEAFPWTPGDTLETRGYNSYPSWGVYTVSHTLYTIQSRIETSDSVWIYLNIESQIDNYPDGNPLSYPPPFNINYPNPIIFQKEKNISDKPHNLNLGIAYFNDSTDNCGYRKRFMEVGSFNFYCDSCHCLIPYDGFGSSISTSEYQEGLGQVYLNSIPYGSVLSGTYASLIYSNVGGITCGDYAPLGLSELAIEPERTLVKIVDITGREIEEKTNTMLIYIYSDGSSSRVLRLE